MRVLMPGTDEGTLVYGAVRVLEGQVPFRDFFEVMGPGTFYWLALVFKILGTTWLATRVSLMVTSVATILLMYFLARRLDLKQVYVPFVLLLATSFRPLWPTISHHGDSTLFALLSFTSMLFALDSAQPRWYVLPGFLTGLTTCFLQPKGVTLFLSFIVILWALCRHDILFRQALGYLIAGYLFVGTSVVLLFVRAGAFYDLVYANLIWPLSHYSAGNSVSYGLGVKDFYWNRWTASLGADLSPMIGYSAASVLVLPFLFVMAIPCLLALITLVRRRQAFTRLTVSYWVAGGALWVSEIHRQDIMHLVYGSPLLIILCLHLWEQGNSRLVSRGVQILGITVFALAFFNMFLAGC